MDDMIEAKKYSCQSIEIILINYGMCVWGVCIFISLELAKIFGTRTIAVVLGCSKNDEDGYLKRISSFSSEGIPQQENNKNPPTEVITTLMKHTP